MKDGLPEGFHALTPHITVKGAARAIDFYREAFGAELETRLDWGEAVGFARLRIGDSVLMLNDEAPEHGSFAPPEKGGGVVLHLYVPDVDAAFRRALAAGAKELMAVEDTFWGDRYGVVADPFGHRWSLATKKEELSPEEISARAKRAFEGA